MNFNKKWNLAKQELEQDTHLRLKQTTKYRMRYGFIYGLLSIFICTWFHQRHYERLCYRQWNCFVSWDCWCPKCKDYMTKIIWNKVWLRRDP